MVTRDVRRPDEIVGRSRRPLRRVRRAAGARRSLAFIGTLVAAVLSLPALALAAPSWLGPQHVSTAGSGAALVDVAANVAGTSIAVFENTTTATVQASVRGPGDTTWPTPVDLSIAGQSALTPRIVMASTGFAVAVWSRSDGANTRIQASTRHATTGVWSAPVDVSVAGGDATNPAVALTDDLKAIVAWEGSEGSNTRVQGSLYDPASETWSSGVDLSAAGQDASLSAVARKPNGDAVAVWLRSDGANDRVEASNYLATSATWSVSTELSAAGQSANNPQVASAPGGLTLAVWQRSDGANTIVQAAVQAAGATTWSGPVDISQPGQSATNPQVAMYENGDAIAVWQRSNGTNAIVQSSSRPVASGIWQPVVDLSASGQDSVRAKIATDSAGTATAVWRRTNGANEIAQAARRPAGGAWTSAVNLSATGQERDRDAG